MLTASAERLQQLFEIAQLTGRQQAGQGQPQGAAADGNLHGLQGLASALDVRHGDGHVILLAMRPQWRGQPFGTFKILFNALLNTSQLASMAPDNDGFWIAPEEKEEE